MKNLPDWFPLVIGWGITLIVLAAFWLKPNGVYVNENMIWYPVALAVAWTGGCVGMRRLKIRHPRKFEALGRPQLFGALSNPETRRLNGYLLRFEFLRQSDPVLTCSFSILLGVSSIALGGFVATFFV